MNLYLVRFSKSSNTLNSTLLGMEKSCSGFKDIKNLEDNKINKIKFYFESFLLILAILNWNLDSTIGFSIS